MGVGCNGTRGDVNEVNGSVGNVTDCSSPGKVTGCNGTVGNAAARNGTAGNASTYNGASGNHTGCDHTAGNGTSGKHPDTSPAISTTVALQTFFWNVHWQCSLAAEGSTRACKAKAGQRFVQLALQTGAQVVAAIELSDTMSAPTSLAAYGLAGWTQVNGPCARGSNGDSAALAFAPGWQVLSQGGGCLRSDYDTRAFAVAKVVPPTAVQGCPSLCIVAIHAPHRDITVGRDTVNNVCGDAIQSCAVAMGDWNVPAEQVGALWGQLIGGRSPATAAPNVRTCCFPESRHYGVYDHIATNILGGASDMYQNQIVHPYQIVEENPVKQHRPVSVLVSLPGAL